MHSLAKEEYDNEYGYREDSEKTALELLCRTQGLDETVLLQMATLLLDYGANPNRLSRHIDNVEIDVVSSTSDPRDDTYQPSVKPTYVFCTCLYEAILKGHLKLVELLLIRGANPSHPYITDAPSGGEREELNIMEFLEGHVCKEVKESVKTLLNTTKMWRPSTHQLYPKQTRDTIFQLLLISRRQKWPLPLECLHLICREVAKAA